MAGSFFAGSVSAERDPSLAFLSSARRASARTASTGERPLEARVRTLQATAGNGAVTQMLQRQADGDAATAGAGAATPTHSKLTFDSRGDEVRDLQSRLNRANPARTPLAIDGIFGRKTQAAVRAFQGDHPPLSVDGDAGPETWAALEQGATAGTGASTANRGAAPPDGAETRDPYEVGKEHYEAKRYGRAYDEFTKAYEQTGEIEHLWNRAQALRLLGGRREDAIALYEQVIKADAGDEVRTCAREQIATLRGPGKTGDESKDRKAAYEVYEAGEAFYRKEEYGKAYDEFTKAYEITGESALLFNRAQALRLLGGRRAETINLYEAVVASDVPEDRKKLALREIADLRGPGSRPDERANRSAADVLYQTGRKHFHDEEYAQAYDAFSKAHEITGDAAFLYNRAQSLRLLGGRRAYAIALFEQFIAGEATEDEKKVARAHLEDLRGPDKRAESGGEPPR